MNCSLTLSAKSEAQGAFEAALSPTGLAALSALLL
jgi:hypothetical protein